MNGKGKKFDSKGMLIEEGKFAGGVLIKNLWITISISSISFRNNICWKRIVLSFLLNQQIKNKIENIYLFFYFSEKFLFKMQDFKNLFIIILRNNKYLFLQKIYLKFIKLFFWVSEGFYEKTFQKKKIRILEIWSAIASLDFLNLRPAKTE